MAITVSIRFDFWVAAVHSGFAPHAIFVRWADNAIDQDLHQPRWVLDLSLSRTAEEAERVLRLEWSRQIDFRSNEVPPLTVPCGLYLGFLYLRFRQGALSMAELLKKAGDYTDGYGCGGVECEAFYDLLYEIDGGGPTVRIDRPLAERVDELFAPFASAARSALTQLPSGLAAE